VIAERPSVLCHPVLERIGHKFAQNSAAGGGRDHHGASHILWDSRSECDGLVGLSAYIDRIGERDSLRCIFQGGWN
jgi:hypothetical protein